MQSWRTRLEVAPWAPAVRFEIWLGSRPSRKSIES
jgi:hypothetical protein